MKRSFGLLVLVFGLILSACTLPDNSAPKSYSQGNESKSPGVPAAPNQAAQLTDIESSPTHEIQEGLPDWISTPEEENPSAASPTVEYPTATFEPGKGGFLSPTVELSPTLAQKESFSPITNTVEPSAAPSATASEGISPEPIKTNTPKPAYTATTSPSTKSPSNSPTNTAEVNSIATSTEDSKGKPAKDSTATPTAAQTLIPPSSTPLAPSPTNTAVPEASATPTQNIEPTATTEPSSCSPGSNSSFETQLIALINEARNKAGLSSLSANSKLTSAARKHSQDMACNNFFSHTSPTTGSPFDRIRAEGYNFSWAGENIAAGYGSAQATFDAWWNSPAHKDNILGPNFKEIGMGYASLSGSPYGNYATAVFASP